MRRAKSIAAILLSGLVAAPGFGQIPDITQREEGGFFARLTSNYRPRPIPATSYEDSTRIDKLMRAGNIYLSLRDAIALALENNLDIASARYTPALQAANLLRAQAGTVLRNVSNSVSTGPSSATLGVLAGTALGSGGTNINNTGNQGGLFSGLNVQTAGSTIPNFDPIFFINGQFVHTTQIQTATNIAGVNALVSQYKGSSYGIQQGTPFGTTMTLGMNNQFNITQNSYFNMYNPFDQASLALNIQQNLLQSFRPSVNKRFITVAKNQKQVSDLTFKNQVMATVANVVSLYWDLVSFNETLKIRQRTLELNTKLYTDNKRRAELGAIAPFDTIQAQAVMKTSQQDVTNAETQVLQQEMILKNALTRSGMDRLEIINARIVPTDHFDVPQQEQIQPVQDLIAEALRSRPDVEQSRIGLEDSLISMKGTKDAMLPQLSAFANLSNAGVAGVVNTIPFPVTNPLTGNTQLITRGPGDVNGYLIGGYGDVLRQLFSRNFPNYTVGVQFNVNLKNRAAQADYITDALNYRQQQIQDKQLHNNIKQNVVNARTALSQAHAAYDNSVEARQLQEQTLMGTQRKYELGTASILDVVVTQRDTTNAELAEESARNQYIHAKVNLENVLGDILQDYDVSIQDAERGQVGREPDLIPPIGRR